MKFPCLFWVLLLSVGSFAQPHEFAAIDKHARGITANQLDSLAYRLTVPWQNDIHKARAIFTWVASNIRYRTAYDHQPASWFEEDTLSEWKSADEMVARRVLQRRVAVCDGYARLFKTLCLYAGLECELVLGFARVSMGTQQRFATNHTWNAVRLDGAWQLVDVTWGSGYLDETGRFVARQDDDYFLAPPDRMARHHYPEDARWSLGRQVLAFENFQREPFRCRAFVKYGVSSVPKPGILVARVGDTIELKVSLDMKRKVASSNFSDSAYGAGNESMVLEGRLQDGYVQYLYIVDASFPEKLLLSYNSDIILHYQLVAPESQKGFRIALGRARRK